MLLKDAQSGTTDKSDALVYVKQKNDVREVMVESSVQSLYGMQIKKLALKILEEKNINNISVKIVDKGALEFTIRARIMSALSRASEGEIKDEWE